MIALSSAAIRMKIREEPRKSYFVCRDYWTRKFIKGKSGTGGWEHSDGKRKSNGIPGDSQARVPIRSYDFVENWDNRLGAYRLQVGGESRDSSILGKNARDSCKEEKKATELNHRELIEGAERQLAWGNPRR
jgi:hypothetical protein